MRFKEELLDIIDRYHDSLIRIDVEGPRTVIVKAYEGDAWRKMFRIELEGRLEGSFTVYESISEDEPLSYRVAGDGEIADISCLEFELIDIYLSSVTLLIHGVKVSPSGYGSHIVVKFVDVDAVVS